MTENAVLRFDGQELNLPVVRGTEGEIGFDISRLRAETGKVTLDYGFSSTAATESAITYLDGENGVLRYRGIPIEQLAEQGSYLETSFLLIFGHLPTSAELDNWRAEIRGHTMLHEDCKRFFDGFPTDAHPMATLSSVVGALSTFYQDSLDPHDPSQVQRSIICLMAKLPTIAAYSYKKSIGQPFLYPNNSLDLIENFQMMMFAVPTQPFEADPVLTSAIKKLLILHADHEQNCSTSTVRLAGSSGTNLFASVAAGINALWGPLHGGANQAVIEMLDQIREDDGNVTKYIHKAKDRNDPFRLMGFGHRVYKNYDPRAKIIKTAADGVLERLKKKDDLLAIALELEEVALRDDYFVEKRLYPNVDFYSGLIYRAMGFPTRMFTVLFAMGRLPGWIAHWKEMMESPKSKLGRPRQIYIGETERKYVPITDRGQ